MFQGKIYEEGTIFLNFEDSGDSPLTEKYMVEHVPGVVMSQQYILKAALVLFGEKGEKVVSKEPT